MISSLSNAAPLFTYEKKNNVFESSFTPPTTSPAPLSEQNSGVHTIGLATLNTPTSKQVKLTETHQQTLDKVNFIHQHALNQLKREHEQEMLALKQRMLLQQEESTREIQQLHQECMSTNQKLSQLQHLYNKKTISEYLTKIDQMAEKLSFIKEQMIQLKQSLDVVTIRKERYKKMVADLRKDRLCLMIKINILNRKNTQLKEDNKRATETATQMPGKARSIFRQWKKSFKNFKK